MSEKNIYDQFIETTKPLNEEELKELMDHRDNPKAREKLITSNLKLVLKVVNRYYLPSDASFSDAVQEGTMGLMEAVDHFDINHGVKFSTYAYEWILKYVREYLRKSHLVVLPWNVHKLLKNADEMQRLDPEISQEKLAQRLAISPAQLAQYQALRHVDELDESIGDTLSGDDISKPLIEDLLEELDNEAEKQTVRLYLGLQDGKEYTFEQIGRMMNCSNVTAHNRYHRAIARLKETYDLQKN